MSICKRSAQMLLLFSEAALATACILLRFSILVGVLYHTYLSQKLGAWACYACKLVQDVGRAAGAALCQPGV